MASESLKPETTDEESFIILGTSPGTSLDFKVNCMEPQSLDRGVLDDAMKELSPEANMALKAQFKIESGPSPASYMVASTIITEDKSTEELQKSFGELLDENLVLKESLQKNNDSIKEHFLLIASCQEDMIKTQLMHKEKFDETREMVEKLRIENKKLRSDLARLAESEPESQAKSESSEQSQNSSGPMSALEFVTSPDDDTIDKLTRQLELVEKQRRQVIIENEKLTWQKESLEHIVDAITKERDDLKEKNKNVELQLSSIENEHLQKVNLLNETIRDLDQRLAMANGNLASVSSISSEEQTRRDAGIKQLEGKVSSLQNELKTAQLKILEMESVKMEFSKHKSGSSESAKMYKEQIQELQNKLKEVQTTVFQPVRLSITSDPEASSSENSSFMNNVKLYDRTLKHLAELLNLVAHRSTDSLVECLGVVASLHDYKLDRTNVDTVKTALTDLRAQLDKQHKDALSNIGQVRGTLSIFEGIFKDYNNLVKKIVTNQEPKLSAPAPNVEALTAALVARGEELSTLKLELTALRNEKDDRDVLKAQLDLYKSDFEAEREAREKMASEKDSMLTDLRKTQRTNQELLLQLEEVRKLNPNIYRSATSKRLPPTPTSGTTTTTGRTSSANPPSTPTASAGRRQSAPTGNATGNMVYTCPKCLRFSSDRYGVMEDHFDFCLDDF